MSRSVLALDIGGTHVTAAQVSPAGVLRDTVVRHAVDSGWSADRLLDAWAGAARAAAGTTPCARVACAIPGPFDYPGGIAHYEGKLAALAGHDVTAGLRARWPASPLATVPLTYVNDAVAFALGEAAAGHGQGARRVIGITLGTGFGSGFIADGQPVTGGPDVPPGGEVRLLPVRGGVADDHLSGPGLRRAHVASGGDALDAREIAARAAQGDARARQVFHDFGHDLGTVLAPWAERFGPDVIVFGGQIARAWPLFAPALASVLPTMTLARSTLLDDANLLGAAAAARAIPGPSEAVTARSATPP
ncbi:ROK family protein [uncultured Deinococcus sp.]|uniref:ROK family protein n=1 Tax=uncultured Deinococcus sp. TaxID=158789 RepID=UPI0025D313F9|nr:ROK family protein [uncultured Deinococcus sp.]